MNSTEKAVLTSVANSLAKSTEYNMKDGNLDEWYAYALQMKYAMISHINVIRGLLSRPVDEEIKQSDKNNESIIT